MQTCCAQFLAVRLQAYVETLDMLEFTKVFYALFLDPWKSPSDVESMFEKQHKSPVITDAKSLYDVLERSESSTRKLTERDAQPWKSLQSDNGWNMDSSLWDG